MLQTLLCATPGEKLKLLVLDFFIPDFFSTETAAHCLSVGKFKVAAEIALSNLLTTSAMQDNSSDIEHDFPESFETDYESLGGSCLFTGFSTELWASDLTFLEPNESVRKSK